MLGKRLLIPAFVLIGTGLTAQAGSAVYEVTFQSTWSRATHPKDFPSFPHYSPLIGATHKGTTKFWEVGGIATTGIENMAETGSTTVLSREIQAKIATGDAERMLRASGLGSPASRTFRFTVSASHSHATLVTMLAPSPDWFVGFSAVNLIANGRWRSQVVIPATVWDSGTDSGTTYTSPNQNTNPKVPIAQVTTASGPFMGLPGPVGTWTLRRVASSLVYGCGVNPNDSLSIVRGEPLLGDTMRIGVHDPSNSMPSGAMTFLFFGASPQGNFPCGIRIPGWGLGSSHGELLIDNLVTNLTGSAWSGSRVEFSVMIPNQASLIGNVGYVQGALGTPSRVGLTDAAEISIGQ